jgi:uncharacterized protein
MLSHFFPSWLEEDRFSHYKDWPVRLVVIFSLIIAAPLAEEAFFRGFLYKLFADSTNENISILLTSMLFAAAHGFAVLPFWGAFFFGVFAGIIRKKTDSLWWGIILHFINNFICVILMILIWLNYLPQEWMKYL